MSATDFADLNGFRSMLALPMFCGGRTVLPSRKARSFPLAQALECESHGVTVLFAVPNVLRGFIKAEARLRERQFNRLRTVVSATNILDESTARRFAAIFGARVIDHYGKAEIGSGLYSAFGEGGAIGVVGGRMAEALIRILDEERRPVSPGQVGELLVHNDCMQIHAVAPQRGDKTPAVPEGSAHFGWHRTGDIGTVTPDGRIVLSGRKSSVIKTPDGRLLLPVEVENVLLQHEEVVEACVFPADIGDSVERVGAVVAVRSDMSADDRRAVEQALQWEVRDRLGAYKSPYRILLLDDFPRVARGKPDRLALRKLFDAFIR
jgi:acyl-coenzyme A synthetase/AMP-(fatty) acid ligase